jgi:hypothetical protein
MIERAELNLGDEIDKIQNALDNIAPRPTTKFVILVELYEDAPLRKLDRYKSGMAVFNVGTERDLTTNHFNEFERMTRQSELVGIKKVTLLNTAAATDSGRVVSVMEFEPVP